LELVPASLKQTSDSLARVVVPVDGRHHSETPPNGQMTALSQAIPTPPPPPRNRSLLSALGVGAALAIGALAIVLYVNRKDTTGQPRASQGSTGDQPAAALPTSTESKVDTQTPTGTTAPAESRAMISLVVHYPDTAKGKLDGGVVDGHPFEANVPKDGSLHRFEVEKDGYKTEKRTLTFDKDIDMTVELTPIGSRPYLRPTSRPSKPPPAETAAPVRPPPPPPEDDANKHKQPQPSVEIDENNPYKHKPK
jgi:hypothetical protein